MDAQAFWFFALLNAGLMMFKVVQDVVDRFVGKAFEFKWLERFNVVLLDRYLSHKNYYRLKHTHDLRIPDNRRGVFYLHLYHRGDCFVGWIGRPLIRLNFDKERLYLLIRVADNAESIVFYDGERQEKRYLIGRFGAIIDNRWAIIRRLLGLDGFNAGVTQVAQLLSLMLQAPHFFAGEIKLGDIHQTVQSFNRLMRALSFFWLFYESFALYQARLNRLYGFLTCLDVLDNTPLGKLTVKHDDKVLILRDFGIKTSDDKVLIDGINITLHAGQALLIQGTSGTGKTTLLKAWQGFAPLVRQGKRSCLPPKRCFCPNAPICHKARYEMPFVIQTYRRTMMR